MTNIPRTEYYRSQVYFLAASSFFCGALAATLVFYVLEAKHHAEAFKAQEVFRANTPLSP